MDWSTRRRIIYGITVVVVLITIFLYLYRDKLFPAPNCFDKKMNGYETGVDCGGGCFLMCVQEINPLIVEWSRFLKTSSSTYDLVSMVANKNINNAPLSTNYKFTVLDKFGVVITEKEGKTIVPVNSNFPIIVQNVSSGVDPASVVMTLSSENHYKTLEKPDSPTIRVISSHFENGDIPRAYVTIKNTKLASIKNIPVRITLLDFNQNVIGVGETFITSMKGEDQKDLVFTWNFSFKESSPQIKVYPIIKPFN